MLKMIKTRGTVGIRLLSYETEGERYFSGDLIHYNHENFSKNFQLLPVATGVGSFDISPFQQVSVKTFVRFRLFN